MGTGPTIDVAIVGAGPYGLSLATHLKQRGVRFRIFGRPMQTWRDMPEGMFLKSFGFATNVYTPDDSRGFVAYCQQHGLESYEPCAIADFARYGVSAQQLLLPELEQMDVTHVAGSAGDFQLTLANGQQIAAERVVIAVGITHFAHMPAELAKMPSRLASHTSHHRDYRAFAGKRVFVIGGGQSSFEAARLLLEAGAHPQLLVRDAEVSFSSKMPAHRSLWQKIRHPQSGLGTGLKSWVLEKLPWLAHTLPDRWRVPFVKSHLGPQGAWWLRDRIVGKVPISTRCRIAAAAPSGDGIALTIEEEGKGRHTLTCDHVVAGTGYVVDTDRLVFLDDDLRHRIRRVERGPALDARFQSSVPGLYFVGLASSLSFGPLFRFVAGAAYTARTLARELAKRSAGRSESVPSPLPAEAARAIQ